MAAFDGQLRPFTVCGYGILLAADGGCRLEGDVDEDVVPVADSAEDPSGVVGCLYGFPAGIRGGKEGVVVFGASCALCWMGYVYL